MNPDSTPPHNSSLERHTSHGYASSESESRKPTGSSGKKRASRAGTRSVTTLSAAQLERKRANDREAQRAIRQRTKDHIEQLENSISDLRSAQESSEKLVAVTQQRNRELEEENGYLRGKLGEAGYAVSLPPAENQRSQDQSMLSVQPASPATQMSGPSIQRPPSTSTARSLSVTASHSSSSRHGSFQYPGTHVAGPTSTTMSIPGASPIVGTQHLTTWRSHDGIANVQPSPIQVAEPQIASAASYPSTGSTDRMEWASGPQAYRFPMGQDQQRAQPYDTPTPAPPPPQQPHQYIQQPVQSYVPPPAIVQHQQPYPPHPQPQAVPSAEFQNMAVSSPAAFQPSAPTTFQAHQQPYQSQPPHNPQQSYQPNIYQQMTPMQAPQLSPQGHMQPPPLPASSYHAPPSDVGHYAAQPAHAPMQDQKFQDTRGYAGSQYPQS